MERAALSCLFIFYTVIDHSHCHPSVSSPYRLSTSSRSRVESAGFYYYRRRCVFHLWKKEVEGREREKKSAGSQSHLCFLSLRAACNELGSSIAPSQLKRRHRISHSLLFQHILQHPPTPPPPPPPPQPHSSHSKCLSLAKLISNRSKED